VSTAPRSHFTFLERQGMQAAHEFRNWEDPGAFPDRATRLGKSGCEALSA